MSRGEVYDNRNHDFRSVLLYDFETGKERLRPRHVEWLEAFVHEHIFAPASIVVLGCASRLGQGDYDNDALARRRAHQVARRLRRRCPPDVVRCGGAVVPEGRGPLNDMRHRSVGILRFQGVLPGPVQEIYGVRVRVPPAARRPERPFAWEEVTPGLSAPEWSLAGRRDAPAESPGDAFGALVQWATGAVNQGAVNSELDRLLEEKIPAARQLMENHGRGGVLAEAVIQVNRAGEMQGRVATTVTIHPGVFANPNDAIAHLRGTIRRHGAYRQGPTEGGSVERRYFWGTWTVAPATE